MKHNMMKLLVVMPFLFMAACSSKPEREGPAPQSGLEYNYHQLALMDLDQMVAVVKRKTDQSSRSVTDKTGPLKDALRILFSRPDDDRMIEKVEGPVRTGLEDEDQWEKSLTELTDEAIDALKNPEHVKPADQVTYVIILQNMVAELKPRIKSSAFERELVEKIRDARIEVTKEMRDEREIRVMKETVTPSELADRALKFTKSKSRKAEKSED